MARPRKSIPTPRKHKGAAVLDVHEGNVRRCITLGPWGSEQATREYERVLTRLRVASAPRADAQSAPLVVTPNDLTVAEALVLYVVHIEKYYVRSDGKPTGTADDIKITLGYLKDHVAHLPLCEFDLRAFKLVRQAMIDDGRVRNQVNRRAAMVRSFVKWCAGEELPVAPGVLDRLRAVRSLAPGRDGVPEQPPREPADPKSVEKALAHLPAPLAAVVTLLRLTGARPSELLQLRPREVDRTGEVWTVTPTHHKCAWRAKPRVIFLGPAARTALEPWLRATPSNDDLVFSPARFTAERNAARSAARQTKLWPSHAKRNRTKRKGPAATRSPGQYYSHLALSNAVRRACDRARVPRFTPYSLRHLRASEIREQFGLEHVRAVLGHSYGAMSAHYARAADTALAGAVAARVG